MKSLKNMLDAMTAKIVIMIDGAVTKDRLVSEKSKKFMDTLDSGTLVLLEYPVYGYRNSTGALRCFNVKITNLDTSKTLNIKMADIESLFFKNIENFKIIE